MNTKTLTILLIVFLSLTFLSCSSNSEQKNVVIQYREACSNFDFEHAYNMISDDDKSVKNLNSYLNEMNIDGLGDFKALTDKSSFKIISITNNDENKAIVIIENTTPDVMKLAGELMPLMMSKNSEETSSLIKEISNRKDLPMIVKTDTVNLIQENNEWKVFLGWKALKLEQEKQDKIQKLLLEAKELRGENKINDAILNYEQILTLDSNNNDALEEIKESNLELERLKEKLKYIENISLYDIKSGYYDTYLDGKVPGVKFKLKNNGNKSLKKVKVTIYFKDKNGSIIFEEDFHPILVTEYSFLNDNKPLKPNYVWSMGRDKFYKVESVPSEWKSGNVEAKITDIEFE